jgi:cyclophilin family peptidyl-prolyl cis-trans isomerase
VIIELFALDAPRHVSLFAELARAGAYDGLRVAAVDGSRGIRIPSPLEPGEAAARRPPPETFPRSILRGAMVALPDLDAGGLFFAHVPLPELEGSATCWGALAVGAEVLDRVEPGDEIFGIRLIDP